MNVHPNQTVVLAVVKRIGTLGGRSETELELEILKNETPEPAADFLKPDVGARLQVVSTSAGDLKAGETIRATLAVGGGPFGERTILRKADRVTP